MNGYVFKKIEYTTVLLSVKLLQTAPGSRVDPALGLLSVWSFACHLYVHMAFALCFPSTT